MADRKHDRNWHQAASVWADDDRFRVIFDTVRDGIFISNPDSGRFIQVNKAGQHMFGYSMDELIGGTIGLLSSGIGPYTNEMAVETQALAGPDQPRTIEWQCKTKSGVLFWAEIAISHARMGRADCLVAIVRDISERKQMDKNLAIAMQKMAAANAAKSNFLATMSHELRTPLNAIIGFSELLLTQPLGPVGNPRYREYIGDIHDSGNNLLALINDILDISRFDAGQGNLTDETIPVPLLLEDCCAGVSAQAQQAQLQIITDLPPGLPALRGDPRRIRQAIVNLLSNAVKFTPANGTITVTARENGKGLVISIRDTGIGIAKEDLPVVLQRFGQTDSMISRKQGGTGLGLPLAKQLIELHGGTLTVESEPGVGTCVTLTFPRERVIHETNKQVA